MVTYRPPWYSPWGYGRVGSNWPPDDGGVGPAKELTVDGRCDSCPLGYILLLLLELGLLTIILSWLLIMELGGEGWVKLATLQLLLPLLLVIGIGWPTAVVMTCWPFDKVCPLLLTSAGLLWRPLVSWPPELVDIWPAGWDPPLAEGESWPGDRWPFGIWFAI